MPGAVKETIRHIIKVLTIAGRHLDDGKYILFEALKALKKYNNRNKTPTIPVPNKPEKKKL